jgi:AcrR family transcriptional regulator
MAWMAERGRPKRNNRRTRARFRKLKPRPGQASAKVKEHQRARIHAATIELVGEGGYEVLTVRGIARAAGVSNRTFYENFADKEECFRATYELIIRHTLREILAARHREHGSRTKMRAGFQAFVREVSDKPKAARLALVEAPASRVAFEQMQRTYGLFEALFAETFSEERDGVELPPLVIKGIVAGLTRVARARVLAGAEEQLPEEADELMKWALSLASERAGEVCSGSVVFRRAAAPRARVGGKRSASKSPDVPGDERAMIASAVARLAADEGFAALTVPRIRAAAGVSRRRFEEHFDDVTDCFLAAVGLQIKGILERAAYTFLNAATWSSGVQRALDGACEDLAGDPTLVRLVFFELCVPAGAAVRWRADLVVRLRSLLCKNTPAEQRPSAVAAEASIGAVLAVLHHYVTSGRAAEITQLPATLSYLVLAPAIGPEAAVEAIQGERGCPARALPVS